MQIPDVDLALSSIYEEVMWLLDRPNVTPSRARAWYTHVMANAVYKQLRMFTGLVSARAAYQSGEPLVLEHYKRIQTNLTQLVDRHRVENRRDPNEFIALVKDNEQVHIVTRPENYSAMKADGDYAIAGIELLTWDKLKLDVQVKLWRTMLRGKVANAADFRPADA